MSKPDNNLPAIENKPLKSINELPERQQAFALLTSNGMSVADAEKALQYKDRSGYKIQKKLKEYDLSDSKLVKGAFQTIKKLSKGKVVGDIEKVKDSTALAASLAIYDRYQPVVKQNLNVNVEQTFIDVRVEAYQ